MYKNQLTSRVELPKSVYLKPEVTIATLSKPLQILTTLSHLEMDIEDLEDLGQL